MIGNRIVLILNVITSILVMVFMGCTRQRNEANDSQYESLEKYSFIFEKSLRDSLISFINDTSVGQIDDSKKITILINDEDGITEISFFMMNTFAYSIRRSVFLGAPSFENDNILIFYTGNIPSVLDINLINYKKGLELLGEETLQYLWDSIRPCGYWIKYSSGPDDSWQIIDQGTIN